MGSIVDNIFSVLAIYKGHFWRTACFKNSWFVARLTAVKGGCCTKCSPHDILSVDKFLNVLFAWVHFDAYTIFCIGPLLVVILALYIWEMNVAVRQRSHISEKKTFYVHSCKVFVHFELRELSFHCEKITLIGKLFKSTWRNSSYWDLVSRLSFPE